MEEAKNNHLKIFALGGLGEIGKNMYGVQFHDEIIIIDAGIKFPDDELFGIDYVIPDYSYLVKQSKKIKAVFITHGHEDHIGGLPYLLRQINVPVYAGKMALGLIRNRLKEHGLLKRADLHEINDESVVEFPRSKVHFFRTTHSIPDSFGVVVSNEAGNIVHTGDFKFDFTPVGPPANLKKIAQIGEEGVLCLLSDSTNSEVPGFTLSESVVKSSIQDIFLQTDSRIIFSTFASNIHRIHEVVQSSIKHGRKIAIVGRSMEKAIFIAREIGYIEAPDNAFISLNELDYLPKQKVTIICTGSQGEPRAALARIADGNHKQIKLIKGDTIVLSSSPIPGNTVSINRIIDKLMYTGAEVIDHKIKEIHTSGHGGQEDQKLMLSLLKPKYFMPIHGEYRMLKKHTELAVKCGVQEENCFVMDNGDILSITENDAAIQRKFKAGPVYVDGNRIGMIGTNVIRDRQLLGENGLVIVALTINHQDKKLIGAPSIVSRGFVYMKESICLIKEGEKQLEQNLKEFVSQGNANCSGIKNEITSFLTKFFYHRTGRKPVILPAITEIM
ncbi:ribonuclease J [Bacillus atrophaeus]|uniref:ribonuclease J1 n=1 Tax=Bacillus atrophaeus TaxID=1452 RepID=UPI001EFADC6F|nr:ribonuclease J [Bacillus atrophaeus]MCG8398132.1 ribonuclease J [Bacillus atrophaeus]